MNLNLIEIWSEFQDLNFGEMEQIVHTAEETIHAEVARARRAKQLELHRKKYAEDRAKSAQSVL